MRKKSKISNSTNGNFIAGLKNKHNNIINGINKSIKDKNEIKEIQEEIKNKIVNNGKNKEEQIIKKDDENKLNSNQKSLMIPQGDKYEGEIKNKKPNGKGKYYSSSGQIREGNFKDGLLNGQGKISYPNGTEYSGNFINDKLNGTGKYIIPNKESYEGEFKNGLKDGSGILKVNGVGIYTGNFIQDYLEGKGKFEGEDKTIYEGEFSKGIIQGKGKKTWEKGSKSWRTSMRKPICIWLNFEESYLNAIMISL